jgi:putative peptidoglycan lipid II flippase
MRLLRSTAIIGGFTLMSRLLGLVRDILLAKYLGAGVVNDALVTAVKLPNLFRRMFAEGAFNAAFVPLYARKIEEEGDAPAAEFAGQAQSALFVLVAAITIFFQLTMPWSLNLIGFGLDRVGEGGAPAPYDLAVLYARITMPYLLLMSMTALLSGVLNTRDRFAAAAFAPVLLNILLIALMLVIGGRDISIDRIALFLAWGWTASGVLQAGLLYIAIRRGQIALPFRRPRLTPGVKRLVQLGIPGLIAAGITHINLMVSHSIATTQDSAASWLYYADRLYQLPLGMIGIAMGIALLPALSRALRSGDESGAMNNQNRAMEIAAALTLPATVALFLMPEFLIQGLFERGRFEGGDTIEAAKALRMFALGLPAFVLLKVLTPAFFARENTRTPMVFAGISAVVNLALGWTLFVTIGFFGLALATSVAAWVNVIGLAIVLNGSRHFIMDGRLLDRLPRIALASAIMGAALWYLAPWAREMFVGRIAIDYPILLLVCALGGVIYAVAALGLRAVRPADIRGAFSRQKG